MTTRRRTIGLASVLAFGCALPDKNLGELGDTTGEGTVTESSGGDGMSGQGDGDGDDTSTTIDGDGDPVGCVDASVDIPECHEDVDRDTIRVGCDNAPDHFNPSQSDIDQDGFGDEADLCPTVASDNNTADSDNDGVGNDCDLCGLTLAEYNEHEAGVSIPDYMVVRNVPWQGDADEDGVGDVCDNCVALANCDGAACQADDDADLVGDACAGQMGADAAGPVGLGPQDDFDQDGITNVIDACPRQPLPERIACTGPSDCPSGSKCDDNVCDHVDIDEDGLGDICDSCADVPNPMQTMDGAAEDEDADSDFVGDACEARCEDVADARPFGYFEHSANGLCCTVELVIHEKGDLAHRDSDAPVYDADGAPLRVNCDPDEEDAGVCRALPYDLVHVPGVVVPPPGCLEALGGLPPQDNPEVTLADVDGSYEALAEYLCFLPQWDEDYDGIGNACDLCPFMFDPDNAPYVDDDGVTWPDAGKYCNGDYSPDAICEADSG